MRRAVRPAAEEEGEVEEVVQRSGFAHQLVRQEEGGEADRVQRRAQRAAPRLREEGAAGWAGPQEISAQRAWQRQRGGEQGARQRQRRQ